MIKSDPTWTSLTVTRVFDAPRELVWRAFTDPEYVMRWWGFKGCEAPVIEIDLRVGGKYRKCMQSPEGKEVWTTGVYREVIAPGWLVYTDSFIDTDGKVVPASYYGFEEAQPLETLISVMLQEREGETTLTLSYAGHPSGKSRDDMRVVWEQSFDKLTEVLKSDQLK